MNRDAVRTTHLFFFTELPDEYGAKDMYMLFKEFREIDEVIIPPKKDKRRKMFGFVRFFDIKDEKMMALKLDNIIIGSRKIHANIPKFNRDTMEEVEGGKNQRTVKEQARRVNQQREGTYAHKGNHREGENQMQRGGGVRMKNTYAQVVKNNNMGSNRRDNLIHEENSFCSFRIQLGEGEHEDI